MRVADFCSAIPSSPEPSSSGTIPRKVMKSKTQESFLLQSKANGDDIQQATTRKLNKRLNNCAKTLYGGQLLAVQLTLAQE